MFNSFGATDTNRALDSPFLPLCHTLEAHPHCERQKTPYYKREVHTVGLSSFFLMKQIKCFSQTTLYSQIATFHITCWPHRDRNASINHKLVYAADVKSWFLACITEEGITLFHRKCTHWINKHHYLVTMPP